MSGVIEQKRTIDYCEPYEDTERIIYYDSKGKVIKYIKAGGSDNSARKVTFYYVLFRASARVFHSFPGQIKLEAPSEQ
jgi:hypothetical protein